MIMKKILLFAVVVSIAFIPSGRCFANTDLSSIVVLGDSIASGYGLPDYIGGNNYSAPLSWGNLLGSECEHYENFARDGMTSEELLLLVELPSEALLNSLKSADYVVVSIGGNDFLGKMMDAIKISALSDTEMISALLNGEFRAEMLGEFSNRILGAVISEIKQSDVQRTLSNTRETVLKLRQINPNAKIVLLTLYNPFSEHILLSEVSNAARDTLAQLNGGLSDIARDFGNVEIADVCSAFADSPSVLTNINRLDIHPNTAGHAQIYELLRDILKN